MTNEGGADGSVRPDVNQDASLAGAGVVVQAGRDASVTVHRRARTRVAWPVRVGVPPPLADHYQHRQAHDSLVEMLTSRHVSVVAGAPQRAGVVLLGLGGVGKSQLAARYAWQVWSDTSVDVALWISALSRDAVITAYTEAATRVLVEQDPRIADRPPERAAELFREWLAGTSRRWLVVLDDVQDPADLRDLDPPVDAGGQVVITSRRRDVALVRDGHGVIELDVFTPAEALSYLAAAAAVTIDDDRHHLEGVAEELGRLPLALSQAAAYLTDQPLLTVTAYRTMLADRRRTLAELTPPENALPAHQATVAVTWSLSIDRADNVEGPPLPRGAGLARRLLEVAALLDPHGIPLTVFTAQPVLDLLTALVGRRIANEDVHDGLTRLHRFNLVTLRPNQPARTVAIHALVQRAVRDTLSPGHRHRLAHAIADTLHAVWPDIDTTDPDLAQALRSNTATLHRHTSPALLTPALHDALRRAGNSLSDNGQVHSALAYWRTLNDQTHTHLDLNHPDALSTRSNLARLRGEAGDLASAVAELEALLPDQSRILGPDHPDTLLTRHNIAYWRGVAGDAAGAVAGLEALLPDQLRILGPDHPGTMITRGNLAYWRGAAGDAAGAVADLEALLPDQSRVLGSDHPDTLITRHSITYWRDAAGDAAGAVAGLEALLPDRLRVLGPDHPHTMSTRHNIAHWRGTGEQHGSDTGT